MSIATPSFFAPFFGDEKNRNDAGLSCSEIGKQARIAATAGLNIVGLELCKILDPNFGEFLFHALR